MLLWCFQHIKVLVSVVHLTSVVPPSLAPLSLAPPCLVPLSLAPPSLVPPWACIGKSWKHTQLCTLMSVALRLSLIRLGKTSTFQDSFSYVTEASDWESMVIGSQTLAMIQ